MKVYAVIDKREPDGLNGMALFLQEKDAIDDIKSIDNWADFFEIRELEVIE